MEAQASSFLADCWLPGQPGVAMAPSPFPLTRMSPASGTLPDSSSGLVTYELGR